MRKGLIIKYSDVAAMLAHEDDGVQANFLSVFANELHRYCETEYHTGMQMASIVAKLTDHEADILWIKKEN